MTASPFSIDALNTELHPDLTVLRLLGTGAVSSVFLARENALRRNVALKILSPDMAKDDVIRQRFQREAQSAARLSHPGITSVYRVGSLRDHTPYLLLQFVDGGTLADRITATGPLSPAEARRVLAEMATALAVAHDVGIIHRDVRPGNVLYERSSGRAIITDFGLAAVLDALDNVDEKLTRPGELIGNPAYMSPEQLRGEPVTQASDLYSLGLVAYDILGTAGPFAGHGAHAAVAHLHATPRPLAEIREDVDREFSDVIVRCLAKDPAHRPSAADVAAALGHAGGDAAGRSAGVIADLVQRRVAPITGAYVVVAWIILQFIDQLADRGILPEATYGLLLGPFVGGLLAAGILAWFHGARGRQRFHSLEIWLLAAAAILGLVISATVLALR